MLYNSFYALIFIILSNTIALLIICFLGIKLAKIRSLNAIHIRQYFISMLSTVILGCLFPTMIATILFLILFFLYRAVIFKNDSFEVQHIYSEYNGSSPPVKKFSHIFHLYKHIEKNEPLNNDYRYTFSQYLNNTIYIFIFYCIKNIEITERTMLYGIEFFIGMTALYIVIAKIIYNISLSAPKSLFFLCPNLSYIPVIFSGLLFYGIAILIFINTL